MTSPAAPARRGVRRAPRTLFAVLRVGGSLALLAFLVWRAGLGQLAETFAGTRAPVLLGMVGLLLLDQLLRVAAWRTLLRARGAALPFARVLYDFLVGTFLGAFVPSSLGTDVARAGALARREGIAFGTATATVLVLNLLGLGALCLVALVSATGLLLAGRDLALTDAALAFAAVYLATLAALVAGRPPFGLLARLRMPAAMVARLQGWHASLRAEESRRALATAAAIGVANQLLLVTVHYAASRALALPVPFWYFLVLTPIATVGRLIPLTVAGFGIQQGIYVYLFGHFGVPAAQALAISLLLGAFNVSFSLLSGGIYAAGTLGGALGLGGPGVRAARREV